MYYLDSSILIPFTLARTVNTKKTKVIDELFSLISKRVIKCYTSFYCLLEVYIFSLQNAKNFEEGCEVGKEALIKILSSGVLLLTMVKREDRINYEHKFRKLKDKSDIPHAILAFINNCKIVTYDKHFNAIKDVIQIITPEEILKEIRK